MSLSRSVALYLGGSCAVLYVLYKVVTPSEDEMRKKLNIPTERMKDIDKKNQLLMDKMKRQSGIKTPDDKSDK